MVRSIYISYKHCVYIVLDVTCFGCNIIVCTAAAILDTVRKATVNLLERNLLEIPVQ